MGLLFFGRIEIHNFKVYLEGGQFKYNVNARIPQKFLSQAQE